MRKCHFVKIAGLTLMIAACNAPQTSKFKQARDLPESKSQYVQSKRPAEDTTRVVSGPHGQAISSADVAAIKQLRNLLRRWNRAAAPFVRGYVDPNVAADRWIREASQHVKELQKVYTKMYACTAAIENAGIRSTLAELTAIYRTKLDCVYGLHNAVAQGNEDAERLAQEKLSNAAQEGLRFAMELMELEGSFIDPQVAAAILGRNDTVGTEPAR